ncbi:cation transporter, partial [Bacillus sp. LR--39]
MYPPGVYKGVSMLSEQKEIAMQVSGMTCAACAARIEKGLKRMPGVTD